MLKYFHTFSCDCYS